ncbi:unnamed protein product [Rhizopus stolonifer]
MREKKGFTFLEKLLLFLSALFFIILCIFAGLYTRRVYEEKPVVKKPFPPRNNKTSPVCLTPECVLTASQILQDIDMTLDPCDDFYQYTCSQWEKHHEIPNGKSRINSFSILGDQNKEILRTILSGSFDDFRVKISDLPDPERLIDQENFEKAQTLFDSCQNQTLIDSLGPKPILPILKDIQRLTKQSLTDTLTFLSMRGVDAFFSISVDADYKDPTVNTLILSQSGLTLPTKDYYEQPQTIQFLYETIAQTLQAVMASQEGWSKFSANATARKIVHLEKKLARISDSPEYFQNPERINNPLSLTEMSQRAPWIDWTVYLNQRLPSTAPIPQHLIVTSPEYLNNLSLLLKEQVDLEAYLVWKAIYEYSDGLSESIRRPIRLLDAHLSGSDPKTDKARWDICLDQVNDSVGFLVGRYYVLERFGGQAKEKAKSFVDSIKRVFLNRLPELSWIDPQTRERAVEKIERLIEKIGYPDQSPDVMSPISLLEYYGDLEFKKDDYFGNFVNSLQWAVRQDWSHVGQVPEKKKWLMNPQEVNAYYNPSFNEIVFPAGILQNPFFGQNYPDYLNYGGIGVVVGHELTHGFDNNGRHFDADGKLVEWWTNATSQRFDEKANCFIKQYSQFNMTDENKKAIYVNGKLTLGENLADNGGLRESYLAWKQHYVQENNVLLPGLDSLSPEKLFFINFGRIWCNKITPAQAKKGVLTDEHSPAQWRVNGAVQNSEYFAEVFSCPKGSRMNPIDKCELW